uniref:Uncharacterized protein n=1 Tax=viral metagenome TaxID=1070528 RepID=A0A6M3LFH9_9ZZZZ
MLWSQWSVSDDLIYGGDEMKVKVKDGWQIRNHKTGKLWPKVYKTEAEVEARLRQMAKYK